jgi:hypothetical protein
VFGHSSIEEQESVARLKQFLVQGFEENDGSSADTQLFDYSKGYLQTGAPNFTIIRVGNTKIGRIDWGTRFYSV